MSNDPDIGIWIKCGDIVVEVDRGSIVSRLAFEGFDQTSRVAAIGTRLAITYLSPEIWATLGAATTEKQIVVQFVPGRGSVAIKHCGRCSLETDNDGFVSLISKDMTS